MAKTKNTGAAAAVALCDALGYGVKAGQLIKGDPAVIQALVDSGSADASAAAVAYATEQGAEVVEVTATPAEEESQA